MKGLRVLLTNHGLAERAGSELYVRDVALELRARGLRPAVFTRVPGLVSDELISAGVPVVGDLADLDAEPDLIHGHHHLEAMTAMMAFPNVPAVYMCHGTHAAAEYPPRFPSIRRYIAVSASTRHRIHSACDVPVDDVAVLPNFVDVTRFPPRVPLPDQPRSLLILNKLATGQNFGGLIAEVAESRGMTVRILGKASGSVSDDPASQMAASDLVVATGRTALEAMATGCQVLVAGESGLGGMVTSSRFDQMRSANFGRESMVLPLDRNGLVAELARYDPVDARAVQTLVREQATLPVAVDRLMGVYQQALDEPFELDPAAALSAAADYLDGHGASIRTADELIQERTDLQDQIRLAEAEAAERSHDLMVLHTELMRRTGIRGSTSGLARDARTWIKRRRGDR